MLLDAVPLNGRMTWDGFLRQLLDGMPDDDNSLVQPSSVYFTSPFVQRNLLPIILEN